MQSRTLETAISTSNIQAQIALFLQTMGFVHNYEEITSVEFPKSVNLNKNEVIPIKIHFNKEGVVLQKIDGEGGKKL